MDMEYNEHHPKKYRGLRRRYSPTIKTAIIGLGGWYVVVPRLDPKDYNTATDSEVNKKR